MRLGILGGTFNPIHLGHLALAEAAREACRLDQVWLIPTATPPHKAARGLLDGRHRLAMVRLAIRGNPAFRACDWELRRGGVSYTINTVRDIHARHPRAKLFLIVGSDMLGVSWYRMRELQHVCTFVVAQRPSASHRARLVTGARRLPMPELDISSSAIRDRLRRGESARYLLPDAVRAYALRHRLYQRSRSSRNTP